MEKSLIANQIASFLAMTISVPRNDEKAFFTATESIPHNNEKQSSELIRSLF